MMKILTMKVYNEIIEKSNIRWGEFIELQHKGLIPVHGEYSPAGVHYPPITNYHPLDQDSAYKNYTPPSDGSFDIYIHIPFCIKRCLFCHYPSLYSAPDAKKDEYLDALEKEMDVFLAMMDIDKIPVRSVLMGGGTPTDLTPGQLKRFLTFFTKKVDFLTSRTASGEQRGAARMIAMQTGRAMIPMMGTTARFAGREMTDTRLK